MIARPHLACPLCGGELAARLHRTGTRWTVQEIWLARRLKALGMSYVGIGKLMGVGAHAVATALAREEVAHRPQSERAA